MHTHSTENIPNDSLTFVFEEQSFLTILLNKKEWINTDCFIYSDEKIFVEWPNSEEATISGDGQ